MFADANFATIPSCYDQKYHIRELKAESGWFKRIISAIRPIRKYLYGLFMESVHPGTEDADENV